MIDSELISENYQKILKRIAQAAQSVGRSPEEVTVVAASKKQPISKLQAFTKLASERGVCPVFGENYVQEAKQKKAELIGTFKLHLIGPLQRNKAKDAVKIFDLVQSVHSEEIAQALNDAAEKWRKILDIFLEVNVSGDPAKAGFEIGRAREVALSMERFQNLKLQGLMTITQLFEDKEKARPDFRKLSKLRADLASIDTKFDGLELSMGMSDDFDVAIEEGATMVRIGTALFGARA